MVKVLFKEEDGVLSLTLDGHAGQADIGRDIVCSACSILAYTVAEYVKEAKRKGDLEDMPEIELESGYACITCKPKDDAYHVLYGAYVFAMVGYDLLAKSYPQFVELEQFGMV